MKQQAAQDGWSSPCMWSTCNKIIEILSHLPCYSSQWNRTVLLFGLPGSFCSINFPYVASLWFCLWISLSPRFICALCRRSTGQRKGSRRVAVTHFHADLVHTAYLMQTGGNKAAGFHGGRHVYFTIFALENIWWVPVSSLPVLNFLKVFNTLIRLFCNTVFKNCPWLAYLLSQTIWVKMSVFFVTVRQQGSTC